MKPVDPRLLRHARTARPGVLGLALLGGMQALATVGVLVGLALVVAGRPGFLVLVAGGFVVRAALTWAEQVFAARVSGRVASELRASLLAAAARRGPSWVAEFGPGRLTALLTSGLDALGPWFSSYLPSLVLGVTLPPLVLVALAVADPPSAVIALVTLPLVPLFGALVGRATAARAAERWAASSRLAGHFLDAVSGLATLRVFGRATRQVSVVAATSERHRAATMRVLRVAFLSSTALDLVATLSVGLIAVEAGVRVASGSLPLQPALVAILLAPEAYRPLREMGSRFHATAEASSVMAEVDAVLSFAPDQRASRFAGRPSVLTSGAVARYAALPPLSVAAGEIVALAGPSGAGKTTALRVLGGLEPIVSGRVEVTGPPPRYLSQRPSLPHARTVGDVTSDLSSVGLASELSLSTPLGERAQGISSGQRHRLALAALLGGPPSVVLLDEPTSHLDAANERLVIELLRRLAAEGCAVVVTSHRPALLEAADELVTLTPPPTTPAPASPPAAAPRPATTPSVGGRVVTPEPTPGSPGPRSADVTSKPAPGSPAPRSADVSPEPAPGLSTPRSADGRVVDPERVPGGLVPVALGAGSWLAGLTLTAAAGWLIVQASTLPPILSLSVAVVVVRGSAVTRPLLRYLERLTSHSYALARLGRARAEVYEALIPRTPGPGLRRRGDLLTRVVDDVDTQVDATVRRPWAALVTLVVATAAALTVLPGLTPVFAAGLLLAAVVAPGLAARARPADRTALNDAMVESVAGLEDLAPAAAVTAPKFRSHDKNVAGLEDRALAAAFTVPGLRDGELAVAEAGAARRTGLAAATSILGLGVLVVGTTAVTTDSGLSPAWAAAVLLATLTLAEPLAALPEAATAHRRARAAAARLVALTSSSIRAVRAVKGDRARLSGVTAGWVSPSLREVDLELRPGARVAVTGASGSGKSTLGAVLGGLLEPTAGSVTRVRTVLVGDETDHVFATTVRENLRLADPSATDERLREVLETVRLGEWLEHHGLDTWLTVMSGGERRRFAIARALLADPELLILDEPTEGLDVATAEALMRNLLAPSPRAVLLLTHRPEGLDLVDETYELRAGRLLPLVDLELGQHADRRLGQVTPREQARGRRAHVGGRQRPALRIEHHVHSPGAQ